MHVRTSPSVRKHMKWIFTEGDRYMCAYKVQTYVRYVRMMCTVHTYVRMYIRLHSIYDDCIDLQVCVPGRRVWSRGGLPEWPHDGAGEREA